MENKKVTKHFVVARRSKASFLSFFLFNFILTTSQWVREFVHQTRRIIDSRIARYLIRLSFRFCQNDRFSMLVEDSANQMKECNDCRPKHIDTSNEVNRLSKDFFRGYDCIESKA